MSRSHSKVLIYVILVLIAFAGTLVDWLLWLSGEPVINTAVLAHAAAIVIGTLLWQFADGKDRGTRASVLSSVMTVVFAPLGSAIHLYQSRDWKAATAILAAFWGGLVVAVLTANFAGNWIATNIIFGGVPASG
ncbi:hypothetical protein [Nitratireductor thuwali]|uniref:Uncharacterized protein n=1 Tax=Nitratireductor thuwali TaxID=2267699 RepID=A0ABY5MER8_9HYPH|nr:hypothetical protein NTH_00981 [Nitratireductor thuwali]